MLQSRLSSTKFSVACMCASLAICCLITSTTSAQGTVGFVSQRPFVIGLVPVVGTRGAVGGIDVDTKGVLKRVEVVAGRDLDRARTVSQKGVSDDVRRPSAMRKVSLRKLETAIAQRATKKQPLDTEMLFLAGLQRVEYVFVYPESSDIVLAGPAEGWTVLAGEIVGNTSGSAVLRLDDLLDALHSDEAAATGDGVTCSIDPTEDGMARLQRLLKQRDFVLNEAAVREMERQLGDQNITLTGIRPTSHFANVMVSADYVMKRLAMNLEASPVAGMPGYMEMLQDHRGATSKLASPRWWLAPHYEQVSRSRDGLAWKLDGDGLQAMSESGYLNGRGELVRAGAAGVLEQRWADSFTERYSELSRELPVFSQLQGCVDLAVVAAIIAKEDLRGQADCPLELLTDPTKLQGDKFAVPQVVPSQASLVRTRQGWVVSVSGGVDLDSWSVLEDVKTDTTLAKTRRDAAGNDQHWWWD